MITEGCPDQIFSEMKKNDKNNININEHDLTKNRQQNHPLHKD